MFVASLELWIAVGSRDVTRGDSVHQTLIVDDSGRGAREVIVQV